MIVYVKRLREYVYDALLVYDDRPGDAAGRMWR